MIPKLSAFILLCLAFWSPVGAETPPDKIFPALEQRLHSLKSLEIQYEADGAGGDNTVSGTMIWQKPDRFYHDAPEWTLVEDGGEQWRFLKEQNTLIRENVQSQNDYSPQHVLFNMSKNFRLKSLDLLEDGRRVITLESIGSVLEGSAMIEFPAGSDTPDALAFSQPDGSAVRYRITQWRENVHPDKNLFSPPEVPAENTIDFRGAGSER